MQTILIAVMMCGAVAATAAQAPSSAGARTRLSACAVMPRELVEKMSSDPQLVKQMEPDEAPIGTHGSSCDYGAVGLQVNPFARSDQLRQSPGKDWQPVAGLGDAAYFRNNADRFAELMVWTGADHFTIQLVVPAGRTPEASRPDTIALANAIIPRLR